MAELAILLLRCVRHCASLVLDGSSCWLSEEEKRKREVDWDTEMDVLPDYHIEQ